MASREKFKEQRLKELESDFRPLLIDCLQECARGRWGLLGQNEEWRERYYAWPEADRLKEMAHEIRDLRAEFGEMNPISERFIYYCGLRGPNDLGEPKMASTFLNELDRINGSSTVANG